MDQHGLAATGIGSPIGRIHVAAGARGLVAVAVSTERGAFLEGLDRRFGRVTTWIDESTTDSRLHAPGAALARWFAGDVGALLALPVDLADRPAWDRLVLGAVRAIPWGETRSYGDIARAIGRPGAARAAGGAVGRNPLALVIPCHRVIAGDGTLGGYGGGWWGERERLLELKATLLSREGRIVPREGRIVPREAGSLPRARVSLPGEGLPTPGA